MKTQEEIKALQDSWVHDPIWDIEDTEGFEDHKEELLQYRKEQEAQWKLAVQEELIHKATELRISPEDAKYIKTFKEIEQSLVETDANIAEVAQVRATLLLASQMKRIADILGNNVDGENWFYVSPERI